MDIFTRSDHVVAQASDVDRRFNSFQFESGRSLRREDGVTERTHALVMATGAYNRLEYLIGKARGGISCARANKNEQVQLAWRPVAKALQKAVLIRDAVDAAKNEAPDSVALYLRRLSRIVRELDKALQAALDVTRPAPRRS